MARLEDVVDPDDLRRAVDAGLVSERRHPDGGCSIFNYTARCAWDRAWDQTTRRARGLIVADDGALVARPFPKFFNLGEPEAPTDIANPIEVTEKIDGSLGIAYAGPDGLPAIATRGSLDSPQASWATNWVRTHHQGWTPPEGVTPLFEIVYPANRVVVDYGDTEGLVLLAVIGHKTGADLDIGSVGWSGEIAATTDHVSLDAVLADADGGVGTSAEGWVLRFDALDAGESPRIKVKLADYARLHRILSGLDTIAVWEILADGGDPATLASIVPDEWYVWVREVAASLREAHTRVLAEVDEQLRLVPVGDGITRRDQAEIIKPLPHAFLLFRLLDGKPIDEPAWKLVRPERIAPEAASRLEL